MTRFSVSFYIERKVLLADILSVFLNINMDIGIGLEKLS